ncbi:MAG: flagellar biosynthetic protein FliO [Deltaproteobacteria bacterium]|nr:flagellar biosynthetic protein FliO [Deltaproteobacteria bacterium]
MPRPKRRINNPDSVKAALAQPPISGVEKTADATQRPASAAEPIGRPDGLTERLSGKKTAAESGPIGISADPTRHFARMAIALFGVLALFVGLAFGVKRYAGKLKKLPFGKKERLIQVVASHYLGNKKSISLVKVTGEYLVVGVSNDGISLISKLGPEVNVDKYMEDRFWGGTFEKHLDSFDKDATVAKEIDLSPDHKGYDSYDGVRDLAAKAEKTTDKIELSPLRASIKEKLTKLKPLS